MNGWPLTWYLRRVDGSDRTVLLLALVIRVAGLAMLAGALPVVWSHLPYPGWSLLLVLGFAAETILVIGYWMRRRRVETPAILADLVTGVLGMTASAVLAVHPGEAGWTDIGYPYVVLTTLTVGIACRTLSGALAAGLLLGVSKAVIAVLVDSPPPVVLPKLASAFVLNAVVGWLAGRQLRRSIGELDRARDAAVGRAMAVAAEQERLRHARILHDRVLQTLEMLARGDAVHDPQLRAAVAEQATWLRRYIENGDAAQQRDLSTALAAVALLVRAAGVAVELNDAALRTGHGIRLSDAAREALVDAVHGTLVALGRVSTRLVVRAVPEGGGVLVTVLGVVAPDGQLDAEAVGHARDRIRAVGGELAIEPVPYAELRVPGADRQA